MEETRNQTDTELIDRVRAGDEDAFRVLCERHEGGMAARVRRRLSPAVLRKISISDILQDARLAAYQALARFEPQGEGAVGAWLGGIAEKKAYHAVRRFLGTAKRGYRAEVSRGGRTDTHNFVGNGESPSECAMGRELSERLRRTLESLPTDYRLVIAHRQREHLTFREIAVRMERSEAAAKMLYGRAVMRLGELLDPEGES
jgi:RNA polymerase sigma-70 factor (ECF subfamily)